MDIYIFTTLTPKKEEIVHFLNNTGMYATLCFLFLSISNSDPNADASFNLTLTPSDYSFGTKLYGKWSLYLLFRILDAMESQSQTEVRQLAFLIVFLRGNSANILENFRDYVNS